MTLYMYIGYIGKGLGGERAEMQILNMNRPIDPVHACSENGD